MERPQQRGNILTFNSFSLICLHITTGFVHKMALLVTITAKTLATLQLLFFLMTESPQFQYFKILVFHNIVSLSVNLHQQKLIVATILNKLLIMVEKKIMEIDTLADDIPKCTPRLIPIEVAQASYILPRIPHFAKITWL
jgi:hypothetical protein